jgi:uncharacterized protein (TIGR02001 family)
MNMKLHSLCLCAIALGAVSARAQTTTTTTTTPAPAAPAATSATPAAPAAPAAPAPPSLSITVTPTFVNQYMFRGQRLGGPGFQPSIEADYDVWAIGVWSNFPISNKVSGQSDPEIDPYGSYTYNVNDSLSIQPGFTLYTYVNANTSNGFYQVTFEPNLAVNYTVAGVKFTPKIYYDVVLSGPTYELNAAYTVPMKAYNSELDFSGTVGTYDLDKAVNKATPGVSAWGNYWLVGVSVPITINTASKLMVGFAYTKGESSYTKQGTAPKAFNSEAVGRGVFSVSYAYTF